MHPVVHAWGYGRQKSCKLREFEITDCALTRAFVELTGFEPVTPSLRKMQSKLFDQGKRYIVARLWDERRETWCDVIVRLD
jgi:hypothetical protein